MFIEFISTLAPWANVWNFLILAADLLIGWLFIRLYKKNNSRNLLNSLPGIFTSLGLLGTFCAICSSLAGISAEPVQVVDKVGKSVAELAGSSSDLDLKKIISDLIPAFSTSIYGLLLAIAATIYSKVTFAKEDAAVVSRVRYKEPEEALDDIDKQLIYVKDAIKQEIETNSANNEKLTSTISEQSKILSKFVDEFVEEMQGCFKAMNETIEQRVSSFGEEQFTQSRAVLESITQKLNSEAVDMIASHNSAVQDLTKESSSQMAAMAEAIKTATEALKEGTITQIENLSAAQSTKLKEIADNALSYHMQQEEILKESAKQTLDQLQQFNAATIEMHQSGIQHQNEFNQQLLSSMSESLENTTERIVQSLQAQIAVLETAIIQNVKKLETAYSFITDKSASIVANYEQASEAYNDAVQNAHDLNVSIEKSMAVMNDGMKEVGKTNDYVARTCKAVEDHEADIHAIIMRVEELGKAIATLQKLESSLSKIASR